MKKMSRANQEYMQSIIDNEGFDYAFEGYSDFEEVEDEIFHSLRLKYLETREKLSKYMGLN